MGFHERLERGTIAVGTDLLSRPTYFWPRSPMLF